MRPMPKTELLLARLDAIGESLARTDGALALLGLGSVGAELERLDEFSDLDFFVIVERGAKPRFIQDLGWLSAAGPLAYAFRNTVDGYKALFADDVFCEFAIFELDELASIPFAQGRVVWKQPHVDERLGVPAQADKPSAPKDTAWMVGEALTNLYVGLGRLHRGEKLSAARLIQGHAVDRILELTATLETAQPAPADPFAPERRFERRFPQTAQQLGAYMQGYERTRESAEAILAFLEQRFEVNPAIARRIRELCEK